MIRNICGLVVAVLIILAGGLICNAAELGDVVSTLLGMCFGALGAWAALTIWRVDT